MEPLVVKRDSDKKPGAEKKKMMNSIILIREAFFSLTFNKVHFWHLTNVISLFDEGGTNVLLYILSEQFSLLHQEDIFYWEPGNVSFNFQIDVQWKIY